MLKLLFTALFAVFFSMSSAFAVETVMVDGMQFQLFMTPDLRHEEVFRIDEKCVTENIGFMQTTTCFWKKTATASVFDLVITEGGESVVSNVRLEPILLVLSLGMMVFALVLLFFIPGSRLAGFATSLALGTSFVSAVILACTTFIAVIPIIATVFAIFASLAAYNATFNSLKFNILAALHIALMALVIVIIW